MRYVRCAVLGFGLLSATAGGQAFNSGLPAGFTCVGVCGTLGANGDVPLSGLAGSTAYGYVSTAGGVTATPHGIGYNLGHETNGSKLTFGFTTAAANTPMAFKFNYVTSDGTLSFIEYGYATLFDAVTNNETVLFNARTRPYGVGTTVPGFGLPPINATVTPSPVNTQPGLTHWSPLGGSSGGCYQGIGNGCGSTGWLTSAYTIPTAGNYLLTFGVVNWGDTAYDTGMAFDFVLGAGDVPEVPDDNVVPEPATWALMGSGLAALAAFRRRRRA